MFGNSNFNKPLPFSINVENAFNYHDHWYAYLCCSGWSVLINVGVGEKYCLVKENKITFPFIVLICIRVCRIQSDDY